MVKLILAFVLLATPAMADHWRAPAYRTQRTYYPPVLPVMPIGPPGAHYERYSVGNYTWTFDWRRPTYQPRVSEPRYYRSRPAYRGR